MKIDISTPVAYINLEFIETSVFTGQKAKGFHDE